MISISELYKIFQLYPSITTDTRKIKQGDIFFALKGPSFNGNRFAKNALEAGAAYAVVDEATAVSNQQTLLVSDVLQTLQQLAKYHREQLNIPVLAITGSNGKTTTKELIHTVLSTTYKTYTTVGNLNNHIGIPLTLLNIKKDAEMAVVEMGANHLKEIAGYCEYTMPTHGLITNCGKAHLEGFGSIEGVRKGKGELFDYLRAHDGVSFICDDFDYFHDMAKGLKEIHWYGTLQAEVAGHTLASEPFLSVELTSGFHENFIIDSKLVGSYNIYNILAACTVGKYFKIPAQLIKESIEAYVPSNSRSQLVEKNGNKIILDAYNANPSSMSLAIENFAKLDAANKILFIGAMKELGDDTAMEHKAIVDLLNKYEWKNVVLVGKEFESTRHSFLQFETADEAAAWWQHNASSNNYILIKGSRSTAMEKIMA